MIMNYQQTEVRALDHIGITVPDLESASAFLVEAFGAVPLYDSILPAQPPFSGQEAKDELGVAPTTSVIAMRMMRIGNGPGIELFEMKVSDPNRKQAAIPSDIGLQHFAVYTDDIETTATRFRQAGGSLLKGPNDMLSLEKGEGNKWMYGKTPWGTVVEFICYPSPGAYEEHTPLRRWKPESL
jgi:catechol 2,3-dioxygenase-like lactoylglutathione lyase family enzyme